MMRLYKFYSETCAPCKLLSKILEGIEFPPEIILVHVDVAYNLDLVRQYNISAVPTLVFEDGRTLTGMRSKETIEKFIRGQE